MHSYPYLIILTASSGGLLGDFPRTFCPSSEVFARRGVLLLLESLFAELPDADLRRILVRGWVEVHVIGF